MRCPREQLQPAGDEDDDEDTGIFDMVSFHIYDFILYEIYR